MIREQFQAFNFMETLLCSLIKAFLYCGLGSLNPLTPRCRDVKSKYFITKISTLQEILKEMPQERGI